MESDITDELAIALNFHGIQAIAKRVMFGYYAVVEMLSLFHRKTFGQVFHNIRVIVDFREWKYVFLSPRAQNKAVSLNHSRVFRLLSQNIVGVNSTT